MKRSLVLIMSVAILGAGCAVGQKSTSAPTPATQPVQATQQKTANGTELDLSGHGLTSIPSDVFSRTDLTRLDVSKNYLTGAPQAEIRHLQSLKYLDLSNNHLTGLPAELGQLKDLEVLNVSTNGLTGLPMELGDLVQLRVLDVSGNPYSEQDLDRIAAKLPNTVIRR